MSKDKRCIMPGFLSIVVILIVVCILPALAAAPQEPAPKKKVLIVWGGWEGHEPKPTNPYLPLLKK
jgi:hypothetical protein